jgi:hypothetical protein
MSENEHDEEVEGIEETLESAIELDTQSQIFLEMRQQNLDLLRVAVEMAGFSGQHPALKSNDVQAALRTVWDIYSEFYSWVDPEESDGDDEDEDEDDQ